MSKSATPKTDAAAAATKSKRYENTSQLGPYIEGDTVVIRAIPYHYIGKIRTIGAFGVTLETGAVWLADSPRWGSDFLVRGDVNESEPYADPVFVGFGVIAEVTRWRHAIPGQK